MLLNVPLIIHVLTCTTLSKKKSRFTKLKLIYGDERWGGVTFGSKAVTGREHRGHHLGTGNILLMALEKGYMNMFPL